MWILYTKGPSFGCEMFINVSSSSSLIERLAAKFKWHERQEERTARFYCEAVSLLLEPYANNDLVAELVADRMQIHQVSNKAPTE